jgi:hypothetical protein
MVEDHHFYKMLACFLEDHLSFEAKDHHSIEVKVYLAKVFRAIFLKAPFLVKEYSLQKKLQGCKPDI